MITVDFKIDKANHYCFCSGKDCKRNPKYITRTPDNEFKIIEGSIIGVISIETFSAGSRGYLVSIYFCYDCIDDILNEIKSSFDKKLWVFK
jgi:hypothetical protein